MFGIRELNRVSGTRQVHPDLRLGGRAVGIRFIAQYKSHFLCLAADTMNAGFLQTRKLLFLGVQNTP